MIRGALEGLQRLASRIVPDPFVLALGLTGLVAAVAMLRGPAAGFDAGEGSWGWALFEAWSASFMSAGLLAFALKMALILVTGHALALSGPVRAAVDGVARLPRTPAQATALVALVACAASVFHWGLGAIVGALLAREIGRSALASGRQVHYPLLGAAAYSGFAVWHGGLSGSAPVTVASEGHFLAETLASAAPGGVIPVGETLFGGLNLVATGGLILLIPAVCAALTPKEQGALVPPDATQLSALPDLGSGDEWQRHPALGWLCGGIGLALTCGAMMGGRMSFDLNSVILVFLFAGIALQGDVVAYARAVADGAKGAGAIILQFPFYFGILGLMKASGLIAALSSGLVALSSATTFPVFAFLSAGIVNFFVPSGGGQWAVQGEILLEAGQQLGVSASTTIMAFSYGDAWTNTLQPFWALPLLGIMGLRARDIIGYTAVVFLLMGAWVPLILLLMG